MAGEAAGTALGGVGEEELCAAPLAGGQCMVVPGNEPIERRVPGDHRAQESRLGPELGLVVDQLRHVARGSGLSGFHRERVPEQLHECRDVDELRRLKVEHAVGVEEQERHVLASRVVERVERARRGLHLPADAAKEEAVVERETDQVHRLAPHAVQLVEPAGREQGLRLRVVIEEGWGGDHSLATGVDEDVGQGRERIDQRVAGEEGLAAQLVEDRLGPTAREEVAVLVGVAAALAAAGKVDLLTGLARRLAQMAGAARSVPSLGIGDRLNVRIGGAHGSAEGRPGGQVEWLAGVDVDARGPDRIVEQHLPEITLRLRSLVAIRLVRLARRYRNVGIRRRNLKFVDATNLIIDDLAQLSCVGTVVTFATIRRRDTTK